MSEDDRETVLRRVEESQPDAFAALVRHTYFGYYGHPTVITALGLDPTPVQPRGHQPDPLEPPDLARVTERGPIYRGDDKGPLRRGALGRTLNVSERLACGLGRRLASGPFSSL